MEFYIPSHTTYYYLVFDTIDPGIINVDRSLVVLVKYLVSLRLTSRTPVTRDRSVSTKFCIVSVSKESSGLHQVLYHRGFMSWNRVTHKVRLP